MAESAAMPGIGDDTEGCDSVGRVTPTRAAVEVAGHLGLVVEEPILVQETNNTVVWLRPHAIIAKVGTHPHSDELLAREHEVTSALAALGAPVGPPLAGIGPMRHPATGFLVTLWRRLDHYADAQPPGSMVGESLLRVHEALSLCDVRPPSFRVGLQRARTALSDDRRVAALPTADRAFLRDAFDDLLDRLDGRTLDLRTLHGEPHDGNRVVTRSGCVWIDFEAACRGPLEWDLAFLPDDARAAFGDVDRELLELCATLNSARVATWCWVQARFPEMRWHAAHHLAVVRSARPRPHGDKH